MKRYISAYSVSASLLILLGLIGLLFFGNAAQQGRERLTQHSYQQALVADLQLLDYLARDQDHACQQVQNDEVNAPLGGRRYRFLCEFHSLFLKPKPSKEKFIYTTEPEAWLDLQYYAHAIHPIRSLAELPASSEQDPQIVETLNDIDERLEKDFYGIVIARHRFNFTDRKIYGTIYSSHPDNDGNRRNHSFKRQVIENLERQYSRWVALPSSRNTLTANETP